MKHIVKAGPPQEYIKWRADMNGTVNEDYRRFQNPEKELLHKKLLDEQGAICAYTMRRIQLVTSHIEHIKPEALCREEEKGSDLDYHNLVACYPRSGMKAEVRYGAQLKDDWWDDGGKEFISPLNNQCELQIFFNLKGEVYAKKGNSNALKTIDVLKLDHLSLTEDRKKAVEAFIFGPSGNEPLSLKKTERAIADICNRNSHGLIPEFCTAIRYALIDYLGVLNKNSQKKKFAKAHKKKQ